MNDLSHIINHLGEDREQYFQSVSPPLMQASNFCFRSVEEMRQGVKKEFEHPFYTRGVNPTVAILRQKLAALEGAEDALVFSSGSGAIAAAVFSAVSAGDHIVCVDAPYSWTDKLLKNTLTKYGVTHTMVDGTDVANFEAAIRPETRLIMMESPNSLTFELQDIPAVVALAKSRGILTLIDNSYASPLGQQPIAMGVDMVAHSASKYLSGHSDLVAGVLCGSREWIHRIFSTEFMTFGANVSPNDAWLLMRGLRTLPLRLEKASANGLAVAQFLENHPKVEKVVYPFLESHPQHDLAKKQMTHCGGMFALYLNAPDVAAADRFNDALKRFLLAVSWGGYESLALPVSAWYELDGSSESPKPFNLVRVYCGLEEASVLIEDLDQALAQI